MWMSNSHATAYYWSHAGQHFEIRDEGDWWVRNIGCVLLYTLSAVYIVVCLSSVAGLYA